MGLLDGKLTGATALISKFGVAVTLYWYDAGTYDTATLTNTKADKTSPPETADMVWWMPTPAELRADGIVTASDRYGLLDATGLTYDPVQGMEVGFADGVRYRVIRAQALTTGGATAAWQLLLRK
jgi:hypothetical protein